MTQEHTSTLSIRMARRLILLAAARGLDGDALARAVDLAPGLFDDPDGRLPCPVAYALTERILEATGDETLGLTLATLREPESFDAPSLVLIASATLREGLTEAFRFQRLWGDGERYRLEPQPTGGARVTFRPPGPPRPAHRVLSLCAVTEIALAARRLVPGAPPPLRVALSQPAPRARAPFEALLGPALEFEAAESALDLQAEVLDAPLPEANARFLAIFEREAAQGVARLEGESTLEARVRTALRAGLPLGEVQLAAVARRLGTSPRTLQRHLAQEGVGFDDVLDRLRHELAEFYIARRTALTDIAFLLGYAEPSVFHRAFRRWTGKTPDTWRREQRAARANARTTA